MKNEYKQACNRKIGLAETAETVKSPRKFIVLQQNLLEILQSAEPIVKIKLNQMVE
jgi:hypothetical protein